MSNGSDVSIWYQQLLAQLAAESYLHGLESWINLAQLEARLRQGANHPDHFLDLEARGELGATRMTGGPESGFDGMVDDFIETWEVVDHLSNTGSGFSATLLKHKMTGEFTLSLRSTEAKDKENGSDVERDGSNGADGQIASLGFAWAQIRDMEAYYQALKAGGLATGASGAEIAAYLADPAAKLNVTGYSLGGHLAQVFTLMHADKVGHTHTYNGAGMGTISGMDGAESVGAELHNRLALLADIMTNPMNYANDVTLGEFSLLGFDVEYDPPTREEMIQQIVEWHDPNTTDIYSDCCFGTPCLQCPRTRQGFLRHLFWNCLRERNSRLYPELRTCSGMRSTAIRRLLQGRGSCSGPSIQFSSRINLWGRRTASR